MTLEGHDLQKRLAGWSVYMIEQEQAYMRLVVYNTIQKEVESMVLVSMQSLRSFLRNCTDRLLD